MIRLTLATMAAAVAMCTQANAAIYTFTPTFTGAVSPFYETDNLSFTIGIDDAEVRSGAFSYDVRYSFISSSNSYVSSATGDVQAFQFFRSDTGRASLSSGSGVSGFYENYFDTKLTFDALGQVTSGNVEYSTDSYYVFISGKNQFFTGISGTGFLPSANVSGPLTGGFSNVPEPATLGILGISLALMSARKRARHVAVAMSKAE